MNKSYRNINTKIFKCLLLGFMLCVFFKPSISQDFSNLKGSKPFKLTGSIGTNNSLNISNRSVFNRDPLAMSMYANLNLSVYDYEIPFSFYFTNRNTNFSHPFIHFGISPRYKALKLHLGYRSMDFSQLTYSGLTFFGLGLEFDYKWVRLGAFSGTLNQSTTDNPTEGIYRPPMFKRSAIGVKLGIGKSNNHFDLIFFRAKDDSNSINRPLHGELRAKESAAIGSKLLLTFFRRLSINAEMAVNAYNDDARSGELPIKELDPIKQVFTPRYNTSLRYAAKIRSTLSLGKLTTSVYYNHVQPDYVSLGTTYLLNNFSVYGLDFNTNIFKNKLLVSGNLGYQQDNISKRQLYTNHVTSYMTNITARVTNSFIVNTNYNGYYMAQTDGTATISDSLKLDRLSHNITITPSYTFLLNENSHSFNLSYLHSNSENLNKFRDDFIDTRNSAINLSYSYSPKESGLSYNGTYGFNSFGSAIYRISSHILGVGTGVKVLKEKNLHLNLNVNFSYNSVSDLHKSTGFNMQLMSAYAYQKNHNAIFRIAYNQSNNRSMMGEYRISGTELVSSLGYSYRFNTTKKKKSEPKSP